MAVTHVSLPEIENAIREVCFALDEKDRKARSWTKMTEDNLWRELVACILGSRVRFEIAHSAVERIEKMQLFFQSRRSSHFDQYERDIIGVLNGESFMKNGAVPQSRYPFFKTRANQIRRAAELLYGHHGSIREFLADVPDVREARRRLASEVSGLGPKQASLFLRNIGYSVNLAILDIHVLTYMGWVGLTERRINSVSTVRKYETLEDAFIKHSCTFGYTPDRFDLAVWVVVKVAKAEYQTWG